MKTGYNSEIINAVRIVSHGKIDSLADVFHLPKNEGFTIYAVPKGGVEADGIRLNVRLVMDDVYSEVPIRVNEWQPLFIDCIGGNQDSILESVDLYWGSGYYIARGDGKVKDAPTAKNLKYTGDAQQLLVAGKGTGTMMYKVGNGSWSADIPTATNVGVYDVQYKCAANRLYTESEVGALRCAIAEKFINDPTINLTPSSFSYSGSPCVPTVEVLDGQRVIPADEYTVQVTNNVNVGTANVVILDNIGGNYEVLGTTTFEIAKVTPTVVAPTAKVLAFNGSAQELVNAGSTDFGTLQYSLDGEDWSTSIPTATNAGSYTVKYRVVGDSNVNDVAAVDVQCSINEKQVTATVELSQDVYTYDGTAKQPTVVVKDGTTVIDPSEYNVAYSNNVNAGTATVTITDKSAGNYNVIGSTTFTINKADRTLSFTTAPSSVDAGSTITVAAAASAGDGTITYSSSNTGIATVVGDVVTGVAAGTCNIIANIAASQNYNAATTSYQLTVEEVQPEFIDLGLPSGTLWARGNIVSDGNNGYEIGEKTDYGAYFSWGNIDPHFSSNGTSFDDSYNFSSGAYAQTAGASVSGNIEPNDSAHDAALALIGNGCKMPTSALFYELNANTDKQMTTIDGVYGCKFMKKSDHSVYIFLPANGYSNSAALSNRGTIGYYWSSDYVSENNAYFMKFDNNSVAPQNSSGRYYGFSIRPVKAPAPTVNSVDLGLPSGKLWADRNVGADSEEGYGDYFSWGNVAGHKSTNGSTFDDSYDFGTSNSGVYAQTEGASIQFTSDTKGADFTPTSGNDAARENLGGSWRMPTATEFQELYDNTDNEWTTINGVNGRKFMKKSDHSVYVFFPAAGVGYSTSLRNKTTDGNYWSSSLKTADSGYSLNFSNNTISGVHPQNPGTRLGGLPVRAVKDPA